MATTSVTPSGDAYTKANANNAPCFLEVAEPGEIRIIVSGTGLPPAASGTYHLIRYPAGVFSYGGNQDVYVRNHTAGATTVKVVVTEVI